MSAPLTQVEATVSTEAVTQSAASLKHVAALGGSPGGPGVVADLQELDAELRELVPALHHMRHVLLDGPLQEACRVTAVLSEL